MRLRLAVAVRKPAEAAATASASGKRDGPVAGEDRRRDGGDEQRGRRPRLGLPVGGEVEDDPEAEGDREPGHEPSRADIGERPGPQPFADRAGKARKSVRPRPQRPAAAGCRPPRRFPSARDTPIGHHRTPTPTHSRGAWYIGRARAQVRSTQFTRVGYTGRELESQAQGAFAPATLVAEAWRQERWPRKPWPRCRAARRCG